MGKGCSSAYVFILMDLRDNNTAQYLSRHISHHKKYSLQAHRTLADDKKSCHKTLFIPKKKRKISIKPLKERENGLCNQIRVHESIMRGGGITTTHIHCTLREPFSYMYNRMLTYVIFFLRLIQRLKDENERGHKKVLDEIVGVAPTYHQVQ